MRVLVDTHALLWFLTADSRLSEQARELISTADNEVLVSIATLWEIAIKASLGRIDLGSTFAEFVTEQVENNGFSVLPIALEHLARLAELPFHHRDPFDRLLVAQALAEGIPLISADGSFRDYDVKLLW